MGQKNCSPEVKSAKMKQKVAHGAQMRERQVGGAGLGLASQNLSFLSFQDSVISFVWIKCCHLLITKHPLEKETEDKQDGSEKHDQRQV